MRASISHFTLHTPYFALLLLSACSKSEKPIDPESAQIVERDVRARLAKSGGGMVTEEEREGITSFDFSTTAIMDLRPLTEFPNVTVLWLRLCPRVGDLTPLVKLSKLQYLYLDGCVGVVDLRPLKGLHNLKELGLEGCTGAKEIPKGFQKGADMLWHRIPFPATGPTPSALPVS